MQWIWVGVNLSWTDVYAVVEWVNDMKLHVFSTQQKSDQNIPGTFNLIWWLCLDLE